MSASRLLAAGNENDFLGDWRNKMRDLVPRGYVCPHTATAPVMDGKIGGDPAWAAAPWTEDFVDIEGDAKPKPLYRTRAKMLWDDTCFYVAAEMESPNVWAILTEHDSVIFNDPDFEVFIDPDGDSHEYYEFEMNALNTGWDLFLPKPYKDGGDADNSWEIPGLRTAVHVRGTLNNPHDKDEGWSVEIAIPWKVLGEHAHLASPPDEGDQWRVGFSHVDWLVTVQDGKTVKIPGKPEFNWIWSAQGVIDMHRPERWGYVQFTRLAADGLPPVPVPDVSRPARDVLQEVYYAQKDFSKKHDGRWAATLAELKVIPPAADSHLTRLELKLTLAGFDCTVELTPAVGPSQTWGIDQHSHVRPVK